MGNAFVVALVGMVVVFVALALIILCIKLYSAAVIKVQAGKKSNQQNETEEAVALETPVDYAVSATHDDSELIAVITAAIVASMQGSGSGILVKSIRRIGHTTSIWNVAAETNIFSKL